MRRVVYGGACSLDGYIAREDDGMDWLMWGDDVAEVVSATWARYDTFLLGRRTYDVAARSGQGGGEMPGVRSVVFSRTMAQPPARGVELVRDDAAGWLRAAKEQPGKDICVMGGSDLALTFLEAGLVDEIGFNVHPVLLGTGIPALRPMSRQLDLALTEERRFANGCVLLTYDVKR
jgi:dihydrofolate reductase